MATEPCPTCPWRVDQDASVIPNYVHDKACGLMNTVGRGDDFRPIMACHHSIEGREIACKGYLAVAGWSNINVRMLLARGRIESPADCADACADAGIELHQSYEEVLEKLERTQ